MKMSTTFLNIADCILPYLAFSFLIDYMLLLLGVFIDSKREDYVHDLCSHIPFLCREHGNKGVYA